MQNKLPVYRETMKKFYHCSKSTIEEHFVYTYIVPPMFYGEVPEYNVPKHDL